MTSEGAIGLLPFVSTRTFLKIQMISYRGAILWNAVSTYFTGSQFTAFCRKVKKDKYVKELEFIAQSVQSLPRHYHEFKCY